MTTRTGRPRTLTGIIDPLIDAIIDTDPRDLDYRSTVWTASLLTQYLADHHQMAVSRPSVSLALTRLEISWKRPRHRLSLRAKVLAAGQRGLKRGLFLKERTMILMLDEITICETPPLYSCYGRRAQQVCVPVTGNRRKRILHGVINLATGAVLLLITDEWVQETHQYFLQMIRACWRGWNIVLFEDRGSPHTAEDSLTLAQEIGIEVRLLPRATPELNAMDHLWRSVKGRALADRPTLSQALHLFSKSQLSARTTE